MRQDFSRRIIVVARSDVPAWQFCNAIAHSAAYIGNAMWNGFSTGDAFLTKDAVPYPRNSQYPIIVKRARSSTQLHNLLDKARHDSLLYHAFIREMLTHTDDLVLQKSLVIKSDQEVELLAIALFGENEHVNRLTKKFGLWA